MSLTNEEFDQHARKAIDALRNMADDDFHALAVALDARRACVRQCCIDGAVLSLHKEDHEYCNRCERRGAEEASIVLNRLRDYRTAEIKLNEIQAAAMVLKRYL